jgi:segregation and condensation protein B
MEDHSLDALGRIYSQAMERREKETGSAASASAPSSEAPASTATDIPESAETDSDDAGGANDDCPVNPRNILEALLFVCLPDSAITARHAASLIRGVSPREVERLVEELNESYAADESAFRIDKDSDGYRLTIREELEPIRQQVAGRIREARLGAAAIEALAVVAYHQPVTIEEVDRLRNRHSAPVLNLLVRRELLTVERDPENRRIRRFRTAPRFLELFGLDTIEDLPQAHSPQGADFLDE